MASDVVAAVNGLNRAWAAQLGDEDVVASGLGVWVLLALLSAGSDGPARAELEAATGLGATAAMEAATGVLARLRGSQGVRVAAGVWMRADVPLEPAWARALPADTIGQLDADAQATLGAWVQRATAGEISRLPIEIRSDTLLALVSALVVRTRWRDPFVGHRSRIEQGPWRGQVVDRLTRTSTELRDLKVASDPQVTTVRVRGDNQIDVVLLLGAPGEGAAATLVAGFEAITAGRHTVTGKRLPDGQAGPGVTVERVTSTDRADRLEISTVAFDLASAHDLLDEADVFGLSTAQDLDRGHFPGVSPMPLAVQSAAQEAIAEFTATGFKAAAVTAIGMVRASAVPSRRTYRVRRVTVSFDRPFGWIALDSESGLVIAFGWVQTPAALTAPSSPR